MSVQTLATIYQWQGRYTEAEELHERALSGREKVLGLGPDTKTAPSTTIYYVDF
jgi:hypothetical protein